MNINKAIILGRVTGEIELRTTPSGSNVASFSVATNRVYKDAGGNKKESAEYHNVVLWQRLAEIAHQYLVKGQLVYVEGRLETKSWQGKDGVTRYRTEIIGENMQLGPKSGSVGGSAPSMAGNNEPPMRDEDSFQSAKPAKKTNQKPEDIDDEEEVRLEDIPF